MEDSWIGLPTQHKAGLRIKFTVLRMDLSVSESAIVQTLLDRITDGAHIIETGTESFRFRRTMEKRKKH